MFLSSAANRSISTLLCFDFRYAEMKFKDYLNSLVSKRKNSSSSSKSQLKPVNVHKHPEAASSADCHYDICGYEDVNSLLSDDQHSRTQLLLARHAELVNNIVGTRSPYENKCLSCPQCRLSQQPSPMMHPSSMLIPPPLPPKLSLAQQNSFSNHNYSSTLATCSPRRECQHAHPAHGMPSQYSTPNPSLISSSSSSLWTTNPSLSKRRSRIRTNPWIGNTSTTNRSSTCIDSSSACHQHAPASMLPAASQPEYCIYDPTFRTTPPGLMHSESFPQATSNGNISAINPSTGAPAPALPLPPTLPASSIILHQSDSGHGFSLSSSRIIDSSSSSSASCSAPSSSSSPDNTSADGHSSKDASHHRQKKFKKKNPSPSSPLTSHANAKRHTTVEPHFCAPTISPDGGSLTRRSKGKPRTNESTRVTTLDKLALAHSSSSSSPVHRTSPPVTLQYRYQRPPALTPKTSPMKSPISQTHRLRASRSPSSSSPSIDDHFSLEFEEIVENERLQKHRNDMPTSAASPRKSPFILPLDDTNVKLSGSSSSPPPPLSKTPPPPVLFSSTLTKTNSRAILKHIQEIENEIRMIKNLDIDQHDDDDDDEHNPVNDFILSPRAYPEDDLDLDEDNIEDGRQLIYEQVDQWVEKCLTTGTNTNNPAVRLHNECDRLSDTIKDYVGCVCPSDEPPEQVMRAFYISSMPSRKTRRAVSFIDQPLQLEASPAVTPTLKTIHECPF